MRFSRQRLLFQGEHGLEALEPLKVPSLTDAQPMQLQGSRCSQGVGPCPDHRVVAPRAGGALLPQERLKLGAHGFRAVCKPPGGPQERLLAQHLEGGAVATSARKLWDSIGCYDSLMPPDAEVPVHTPVPAEQFDVPYGSASNKGLLTVSVRLALGIAPAKRDMETFTRLARNCDNSTCAGMGTQR